MASLFLAQRFQTLTVALWGDFAVIVRPHFLFFGFVWLVGNPERDGHWQPRGSETARAGKGGRERETDNVVVVNKLRSNGSKDQGKVFVDGVPLARKHDLREKRRERSTRWEG